MLSLCINTEFTPRRLHLNWLHTGVDLPMWTGGFFLQETFAGSQVVSHVTDIQNKFVQLNKWSLLELHSFSNIANAPYDMK